MIQRPTYLKRLIQLKDNENIKIITGVRRAGKSVLLMLYRDYLLSQGIPADNIIYFNFEDFSLLKIQTADQLRGLLANRLDKTFERIYC